MRTPRRPDPEVMESDYRVPTALGTAAWAIALLILLAMGDRVAEADRWWFWVCVVGMAFGVFAYFYIPWLLRKGSEQAEQAAPGTPPESPGQHGDSPTANGA